MIVDMMAVSNIHKKLAFNSDSSRPPGEIGKRVIKEPYELRSTFLVSPQAWYDKPDFDWPRGTA